MPVAKYQGLHHVFEDTTKLQGTDCPEELVLANPFLVYSGLDVKDFISSHIEHLAALDYGNLHSDNAPTTVGKIGARLLSPELSSGSDAFTDEYVSDFGNPAAYTYAKSTLKFHSIVANGDFHRNDCDDIDYKDVDTGKQDEQELTDAVNVMIQGAYEHIPDAHRDDFRNMVLSFRDIFRTRLGSHPAVDIPPLTIEFEDKERPVKVRQRTCSPEQRAFLKEKYSEMEELGLDYRNPTSKWACASLVVPKPSPEKFRFTVELCPVNAQTKKNVWPMPLAEPMFAKISSAKYFSSFDFVSAYWQMPLDTSSQECHRFHNSFGVFTSARVLHGATNSVTYYQSTMEALFSDLDLLIWLDDLSGHAKDLTSLISNLESFFTICRERDLNLHTLKCALVSIRADFCGRTIDRNGIRFNPRNYSALTSMAAPTTVGSLIELVHGANWMRSAISRFYTLIQPLHDLLESQYTLHKSRKKSRLANRPLSAWGDSHQKSYTCFIHAIVNQVTLATPNPGSDSRSQFRKPSLRRLEYSPIAFVSGSFNGAFSRWSTPEQESYAVVASVTRLGHILATCSEFSLFTDHKNILFMFSPTRYNANFARHVVHKTERWAVRLSEFNFIIENIPGVQNTWADTLTRWAAPGNGVFSARRVGALRVPLLTQDLPELSSLAVISASQTLALPPADGGFKLVGDIYKNKQGRIYVPADDEQLQIRIFVAAHCGLGGHRGTTATTSIIKESLIWPTMEADISAFVQSCLVCLLSTSGGKVPRPLGHQVHAEHVNKLLHFDFLYIGDSRTKHEYILILKDDFSGYCYLCEVKNADDTTAEVLLASLAVVLRPRLPFL